MRGSDRLNTLSESQTLALTRRVRELKKAGKDVLGLTLGEPDFDTPTHIRQAAIDAILEGFTHYPPVAGIPELREACAEKFRRENGMEFKAANVVVSTGAKQSIVNAVMSLVNPGDEVILIAPYWVSYLEMIKMAEGRPVVIHTTVESGFRMTPEQLEAAITPRTRMLMINSPSNPTGTMYSEAELAALVEVLERHPQVFVLSDEIYEHLAYDARHVSPGSFAAIADRTITVNGFSKSFAMTGWRVGYIGAPQWIAELCEKFQGQITSGTSSISQRAALAGLNGSMQPTFDMREAFHKRRDFLLSELAQIPGLRFHKPEGAFYVYPDCSAYFGAKTRGGETLRDIDHFTEWLLEAGNVAVIPGTAFGSDLHVRISYAYSQETLQMAVERIRAALSQLQ